jgi:excisionase family DNA binding protein
MAATMTRMADLPRFLTLADVAEVLNTSVAQVYAMVRRDEIEAIKIGGRGQWRVSEQALMDYIDKARKHTKKFVEDNPFHEPEGAEELSEEPVDEPT